MTNKPVVLVVDDDELIVELLTDVLQDRFAVATAENGVAALDTFRRLKTVAGVVTDFQMPAMGGVELVRRLRRLNPTLPILVLSGTLGPPKEAEDVLKEVVFLQKPFEIAEFWTTACRLFLPAVE